MLLFLKWYSLPWWNIIVKKYFKHWASHNILTNYFDIWKLGLHKTLETGTPVKSLKYFFLTQLIILRWFWNVLISKACGRCLGKWLIEIMLCGGGWEKVKMGEERRYIYYFKQQKIIIIKKKLCCVCVEGRN